MRRALPRLLLFVRFVVSFSVLGAAHASAQDRIAAPSFAAAFPSAPAAPSATPLFPATPPRASEAAPAPIVSRTGFDGRRPALLPALYVSTIALQALDAHSTLTAIRGGAHEANPLMKGVAGNRGALLAVKAGVAAGTIVAAEKMWKRSRAGAIAMMVAVNAIDAFVVTHNYRVASALR